MIGLVDYGLGNIQAFADIFRREGVDVAPARTPQELTRADKLVLPGVGAFDWAMSRLDQSGMRQTLDQLVLSECRPIIGVCVGMQMMVDSSEEGSLPGLGWISGKVRRLPDHQTGKSVQLPHMGWNDVDAIGDPPLLRGITEPRFYFLHSYYVEPTDEASVIARVTYGRNFAAAIRRDNIYGTQFHPEKSHDWGVRVLRNFARL
jgi:imidazole glycerol-phosphate synthase subunit HisH